MEVIRRQGASPKRRDAERRRSPRRRELESRFEASPASAAAGAPLELGVFRGPEPTGPDLEPGDSRLGSSSTVPRARLVSTPEPVAESRLQQLLDDLAERWNRGENPTAEEYLKLLGEPDPEQAVTLIYREYCLAELAGQPRDPGALLERFPQYREPLARLLTLDEEFPPAGSASWLEADGGGIGSYEPGDEIGPFVLRRELGRGSFARVFLAEQSDLANRLVVVKLTSRPTREPWLLARARHPYIIEILSHAFVENDGLQLIAMPFWGGATLAALLAHRRGGGRRWEAGGLVRDLEAVAAPEYRAGNRRHPARERLESLSDPQALAWVVARLAEALDHAFTQGIVHGDVKPSNILLTAEGNPMLLDLNLAQDWSTPGLDELAQIPGGTLLYMAPERLRRLAVAGPPTARSSTRAPVGTGEPEPELRPDPSAHQADLYSLGMVLLEALTGQLPLPGRASPNPTQTPLALELVADRYASAREQDASAIIAAAEASSLRPLPAALRSILAHCLAPSPQQRYRRGLELAEDLDRWCDDRPLAYAVEPFWRHTVPRSLRRRRRALAMVGLVCLFSLASATLALRASFQRQTADALHRLARLWDDPESRAFRFQRPGNYRLKPPSAPEVLETAVSALRSYDVLGPGDWRRRDEVCSLPPAERSDLESWLTEQIYRYCRALEERPASPGDWHRALEAAASAVRGGELRAFTALRRRLAERLAVSIEGFGAAETAQLRPEPVAVAGSDSEPILPAETWLDEYLMGVAAEFEDDAAMGQLDESVRGLEPAAVLGSRRASSSPVIPPLPGSIQALAHYSRALAARPDSFWANYRAAVVCFRLQRWQEACVYLDQCLKLRPRNAVLRGQFPACLDQINRLEEALAQCNLAVAWAPDHAEFFRSRAFIRAKMGQIEGLKDDLRRFEMLRLRLPSPFFGSNPHWGGPSQAAAADPESRRILPLPAHLSFPARTAEFLTPREPIDADELDTRAVLAAAIRDAGDPELAAAELEKILALDPHHLTALLTRMMLLLDLGRAEEASVDLAAVLDHPHLPDAILRNPARLDSLNDAARRFARAGFTAGGLRLAELVVDLSRVLQRSRGRAHYTLAVVHAIAGRTDAAHIPRAAKHLRRAISGNAKFRVWYEQDSDFDPVRNQLGPLLEPPVLNPGKFT